MIGTIANTCLILLGSCIGGRLRAGLKPKYQGILFTAMGLVACGIGMNAVVQNMPHSQYPVLFIAALSIGGVIGCALDLNERFDRLVSRTSNNEPATDTLPNINQLSSPAQSSSSGLKPTADQTASGQTSTKRLAQGLSTAIMLFCIGTLSMLGPINSALYGDETFLFTNATLDFVTSMVLASTFGYGIAFAAPVLFIWQGSIYLAALFIAPYLTDSLMCEVSIVGGFLILASGFSILEIKEISTLNLLPALGVPVIWFILLNLTGGLGGLF